MSETVTTATGVTLRLQLQSPQGMELRSKGTGSEKRKGSVSLTLQEQMEKLVVSVAEIAAGLKSVTDGLKQTQDQVSSGNTAVNSAIEKLQADIKADIKNSTQTLEKSIGQIEENVRKNREEINRIGQEVTTLKKDSEEIKVVKEKIKKVEEKLDNLDLEQIESIGSRQRSVEESLAFLQLHQREGNIRRRNLPELEGEDLKDYIVKLFSGFWEIEEINVSARIVKAFRFGPRGSRGKKSNKTVSDCLIVLHDRHDRDYFLDLHYRNNLVVEQNKVIFYKDIPRFFLDKRVPYNDLATELRKRKIPFSWEFPEGLAFTFEGKKIRIRSLAEKQKFLDKHLEQFKGTPLDPAQFYRFPEVFPPPPGPPPSLPSPGKDPEEDKIGEATGGED